MRKLRRSYPKIAQMCSDYDHRQALRYMRIAASEIWASDAHSLIIHKTEEVFSVDLSVQIEKLGSAILVHRLHAIEMMRSGCDFHQLDTKKQQIKYRYRDIWHFVPYQIEGDEFNYPDVYKVFPDGVEKIGQIGVNPDILIKLYRSFGRCHGTVMKFYGANKPIIITPNSPEYNCKGLAMPQMIND